MRGVVETEGEGRWGEATAKSEQTQVGVLNHIVKSRKIQMEILESSGEGGTRGRATNEARRQGRHLTPPSREFTVAAAKIREKSWYH